MKGNLRETPLASDHTERNADSQKHPYHLLVVGGGCVGLAAATHFADRVAEVTFIGEARGNLHDTASISVHHSIPSDAADVREIRNTIGDVDVVLAMGNDSHSLYLAYLCNREFVPAVTLATLNDPARRDAFDGTDVTPILTSELLARHVSCLLDEVNDG